MKDGIDAGGVVQALWVAALRDAAGPLSAFMLPETMGVSALSVEGVEDDPHSAFLRDIRRRIDLGRALAFRSLLPELEHHVTSTYRHQLSATTGVIRGQLHLPAYQRERAKGNWHRFPVVRVENAVHTPENLLASEGLACSLRIARAWSRQEGAEGRLARQLVGALLGKEATHPWAALRSATRPPTRALVPIVRGRVIHGAIPKDHPSLRVAALLSADVGSSVGFAASASTLALAATEDQAFADRLFELLCVAWLSDGLRHISAKIAVHPDRLKKPGGQPLVEAEGAWGQALLFFQTPTPLGSTHWKDRTTGRGFRAMPDLLLELRRADEGSLRILIDAKNRGLGSSSEVAYKLLGYKENLRRGRFIGVALFPSVASRSIRRLQSEDHHLILAQLPLPRGRRIVRRALRSLLRGWARGEPTER